MTDVSAADYTITGFTPTEIGTFVSANQDAVTVGDNTYTLAMAAGDTLTIMGEAFVGNTEEYYLQMDEDATLSLVLDLTGSITVEINSGVVSTTDDVDYEFFTRKFISGGVNTNPDYWYDDITYPMNFVVAEGATFNIRCPFIATATTLDGTGTDVAPNEVDNPATITNNGTINVASTMTFEEGAEAGLTGELTLADGAQIIASTDISDHIANSDVVYDAETGTYATRANYTEVDALIAEAEALVETDYTEESWAALQEALDAVVRDKTSLEQATVDGYAMAIEDAIAGLDAAITVGEPDDSEGVLGDSTDTPSEEVPEVPQTFDSLGLYIGAGALSIGAIVGAVIYLKRKNA